tara:strand:- start:136 stop:756 length:621 start_codon:yes stop_codon:yes gene_type:complete
MEVTTDDGNDGKQQPSYTSKVVPKFSLVPGRAHSSMALSCAYASGFPIEILTRANQVMDCFVQGNEILPISDIRAYVGSDLGDYSHLKDQAQRKLESHVLSMIRQEEWSMDTLCNAIQSFNDVSSMCVTGGRDDHDLDQEQNQDQELEQEQEQNVAEGLEIQSQLPTLPVITNEYHHPWVRQKQEEVSVENDDDDDDYDYETGFLE